VIEPRIVTRAMKLIRGNAWTEIHGASSEFLTALGSTLSVPVELGTQRGARFGYLWTYEGQLYGSMLHGHRVPAGLTPHVQYIAAQRREQCEVSDFRQRPEERLPWWSVRNVPWRPYQDEVQRQIAFYGAGVIDAPPRSGKTLMAARAIDALGLPVLYVAPSVAIVRQTYEVFCKHFGSDFVARLDGEAKPHERDIEKPIVVATAPSAVKQDPLWYRTREVLVIDEFHHAAADTYHRIAQFCDHVFYRFCFTGTHFRTGEDRLAMEAICSSVLRKIEVDELIAHGFLAEPRVIFAKHRAVPLGRRAMDFDAAYQLGIVDNEERNACVAGITNTLTAAGESVIVLTRRRAHADLLGAMVHNAVVVKGGEGALSSKAVREFGEGRFQVLVGTTVIGEGVDVPRASALVFASGGNDGVMMMQSYFRPLTAREGKPAGRIYDFIDTHQGTLQKHSENRVAMARQQLGERRVIAAGL
jgi:superfamily II DNA or RNA helicase